MVALKENQIDIWSVQLPESLSLSEEQRLRKVLSDSELKNLSEITFEKTRIEYLMTRALIRIRMSEYFGRPVECFKFKVNHKKRPILEGVDLPYQIHFSISHTAGLLCCAFARFLEIGIDVENIRRNIDFLGVGESVFSKNEMAFLKSQTELKIQETFYRLWTLKEAYLKALGLGLVDNMNDFEFLLDSHLQPVSLKRSLNFPDQTPNWKFSVSIPGPDHYMALVYQTGPHMSANIIHHRLLSL